ncbi:Hpt domain-containing protein [Methylobacter sp. BBA5.1]|uniref:Hpt domain-containing protein n=1 Tax=Methylobacter sp. BBA5.1 TaxID=1495064 RepID=UPI001F26C8F8|nr:Hpt domain-containing protein [Methylobacter sp. BBA5.1]
MTLPTKHATDYIQAMLEKTYNNRPLSLTIFKKLFEELPEQISAINKALNSREYTLARQITHKLHGSASFCGLTDMQEAAHALESCLLNQDFEATDRHFLTLHQRVLSFISHQAAILADLDDNSEQ